MAPSTMFDPLEHMISTCGTRCTRCQALGGACEGWEQCSRGWTAEKGRTCRHPKSTVGSTKVRYWDQFVELVGPSCGTAFIVERHACRPPAAQRVEFLRGISLPGANSAEVFFKGASERQITDHLPVEHHND